MDLKDRVKDQFLPKLFEEVRKLTSDESGGHKILIASHGLFLKELHLYLAEMAKSKEAKNLGQKIKMVKESHAPLVKSHFVTSKA